MTAIVYDNIAGEYDRRYQIHDYPGIRSAILDVIPKTRPCRILEVGCGTGKWLRDLGQIGCDIAGVDPSREMLELASTRMTADLRQGFAEALPWTDESFDAVCFINSLHHIPNPEIALREAHRVLRPGGTFISIGLDPHERTDHWFVYEFFPRTLDFDLSRFPSRARRLHWLESAGFTDIAVRIAERLEALCSLEEALRNGVLQQSFTSQLTALAPEEYNTGMQRIREVDAENAAFRLVVDLTLYATAARTQV